MSAALYQARSLFYVGHYVRVVEIYKTTGDTSENELYYLYLRSLLGLRMYDKVSDALDSNCPGFEFQAIRICAEVRGCGNGDKMRMFLTDVAKAANPRVIIVAAQHFLATGELEDCARIAGPRMANEDAEAAWILCQLYAKIYRADLCMRVHDLLRKWKEPLPVLMQLCEVLSGVMQASVSSIRESVYALEELVQTFAASTFLLTMLGTCHLALGNPTEALQYLQDAISFGKSGDALANIAVSKSLLGLSNAKELEQLKQEFPTHPLAISIEEKKQIFDRLAKATKK